MKKYLAFLLAMVLMFGLCACGGKKDDASGSADVSEDTQASSTATTTAAVAPEDLYEWQEVSGGVEITKYLGNETKIVVPSVLGNKAVVSAGTAFSGNVVLEEMELPDTVTKADLSNCKALKRLTVHGKITTRVQELNLIGCTALEYLSLSNNKGLVDDPFKGFVIDSLTSLRDVVLSGEEEVDLCGNYGTIAFDSFDTLDISGAMVIHYAAYFSEEYPIDVTINSEINKCYVVAEYNGEKEKYEDYYYCMYVEGEYEGKRNGGKEITITDENRAKVYCEVFRCKKVTVNGVEYECDSVVDNFRG